MIIVDQIYTVIIETLKCEVNDKNISIKIEQKRSHISITNAVF